MNTKEVVEHDILINKSQNDVNDALIDYIRVVDEGHRKTIKYLIIAIGSIIVGNVINLIERLSQ